MGRSPVRSMDRMLIRRKLLLVGMMACVASQQRIAMSMFSLTDDESQHNTGQPDDEDFIIGCLSANASLMAQMAVLTSALEPFLRPKIRYKIGPEKFSFERLERQFGDSTTVEAQFRFSIPKLKRLFVALRFPDVIKTRSRHAATGEEVFLYMLRRLAYPYQLSTLAWDSGRSISAQSEIFQAGIDHVFSSFPHLRDNRSLECWARHFPRYAYAWLMHG